MCYHYLCFMKQTLHLIYIAMLAFVVASCGNSDEFVINGTIHGVNAQNVQLSFMSGGGVKEMAQGASSGRFSFHASAPQPTLAVVSLSDGTPIATLVVRNGDDIEIEANVETPLETKVKGNSESEALADWTARNAALLASGNPMAINAAVKEYLLAHRSSLASTALLLTHYQCEGYEAQADSLFSVLDVKARPAEMVQGFNAVLSSVNVSGAHDPVPFMTLYERSDSMVQYMPGSQSVSMLCFVSSDRPQRDSISSALRRLTGRYDKKRFRGIEMSTASDSASWRQSLGRDTVAWTQSWQPGSLGSPNIRRLAVPRVPYFIVCDSTGRQLYRGSSVKRAEGVVNDKLR